MEPIFNLLSIPYSHEIAQAVILDVNRFILILVIIVAAISFFKEWVPLEVTALCAMGTLMLFSVIDAEQALSGFSNKAVIVIGAIFVISKSLVKTGFLEVIADKLYSKAGNNKWFIIFIFLITTSLISGLINNTAAVAIFIPLAINLCQRFHISPTKVLLPLSYAAIFGGTLTLIGTSTNLLVNSIFKDSYGGAGFGMLLMSRSGDVHQLCKKVEGVECPEECRCRVIREYAIKQGFLFVHH